jgi:hypothetical protein
VPPGCGGAIHLSLRGRENRSVAGATGLLEGTGGAWISDPSTGLTVELEGPRVGWDERAVAFAADGEADHVAAAVVILDDGPDDDGVSALRGLHLGAVQGGCDLEDVHGRHGNGGDLSLCSSPTGFTGPLAGRVELSKKTTVRRCMWRGEARLGWA